MPISSSVGTSGRLGQRFFAVTAIGRTLPPSMKELTEPRFAV
jgi:hypothetical protein